VPIILLWNIAAIPFGGAFNRWLAELDRSTLLLGKWLKQRLGEAERLDRMSAGFKVFRFYNGALTARIPDSFEGALLTEPVAGVGTHVVRALDQWNVARDVRNQARSAALPAELFRVVEEMSIGIRDSLRRFARPTRDMFDPNQRRASDLFGLGALAFRTLGEDRDALYDAMRRLRIGLAAPGEEVPDPRRARLRRRRPGRGNEPRRRTADPEPELPIEASLDAWGRQVEELARYVAGALFAIPALSHLIQRMGGDALTLIRYRALEKFEEFEALALGARRDLLVGLRTGMLAFGEATLQLMTRIGGLATGYIRAFTAIGTGLMRGVTDGVVSFARQLEEMWRGVSRMIDKIVTFSTALANVDLGEVIHLALVTVEDAIAWIGFMFNGILNQPERYHAPAEFPVTIGELALNEGQGGTRANAEIQTALRRLTAAGRGALLGGGMLIDAVAVRIRALESLRGTLALPRAPLPAQPTLTFDPTGGPNLVGQVVQPLRRGLTRVVSDLGVAAEGAVTGVLGAGVTALTRTADSFETAAAVAARTNPQALMRRLAGDPNRLMSILFDGQETAQTTSLDAVSRVFEGWLVQGGFDTIARASGGYLEFVLEEWLLHVGQNSDTPVAVSATSPKRLLQRAQLGEVHVPELRIVATGERLSSGLANRVANGFQAAVQGAYRSGRQELGRMAKAAL
jgi:hypothetical protein